MHINVSNKILAVSVLFIAIFFCMVFFAVLPLINDINNYGLRIQERRDKIAEYGSRIAVAREFDAFAKKIPIMYTDLNNQFFLTLAVSYRFGWVVAARYKTPKITKEGKRKGE